VNYEIRYFPIVASLVISPLNSYREEKPIRQETPLCRIFGCKKEDIYLGMSVGELLDDYDIAYASEDYETACTRCYKVFGYKYISVVR
jgi:hypothetical protein